jgi:soluble lytic murein transglycosylase
VRARELTLAGLRSRATLEWRHADAVLSRDERAQSIHLAARWELYDIAVATATALEIFADYDLLYPRPYRDAVRGAARTTGIDLPLLYGLLRQESLFRPDAVSGADAIGVAQLQPSTAALAARSRNLPAPSRADLFDPGTSISLGAARLAALLEEFDGQLAVALAAYNAGNGRALRWLPENPLDTDIWIENIPFNETRAYVRRVLWHSVVYEWLDRGRPVATGAWIDVVRPLTAD